MQFCNQEKHIQNRVKDRDVQDAYNKVKQWRSIYENGIIMENGIKQNYSLAQAALIVNIPRKTLEDYSQIFKKISLISQIEKFIDKKMGDVRSFLKRNKAQIKKVKSQQKQEYKSQKNEKKQKKLIKNKQKIIKQQQYNTIIEFSNQISEITTNQQPKLILFSETDSNNLEPIDSIFSWIE